MKKTVITLILFVISISAQIRLENPADVNTKGPKIFSPNRFHFFGDLREGQIVSHEFTIKNIGSDTLKILKVRSSCGCTVAKLKKDELAPGDSTTINVTFNSKNRKGAQTKYVYVLSNDPVVPKLKFVLKANVFDKNANIKAIKNGPRLKLQTYQVNFGKVEKGVKKTARLKFSNVGKLPLKVTYVKGSSKCLTPFVNKYQLEPGESGILEINLDTSELQGAISRTVAFKTNDPMEPVQIITVFVEIKKDKENKDKK